MLVLILLSFPRIIAFDNVCHVTRAPARAAIADFHIVPVKQLVESVCFREMFINQAKE